MTNCFWPSITDAAGNPDNFGPIISGRDVRLWMLDTIKLWSPIYIAEVATIYGLRMEPFGEWEAIATNRALPPNQQAACWTTCTTTAPKQAPERRGTGMWWATWLAQANIVVFGKSWGEAEDLVHAYCAAVRACILQHRDLGAGAHDTWWLGEASKELEHQSTRTVQLGQVLFAVQVANVIDDQAQPASPTSAGEPGPTVDQIDISIIDEPIDEPLTDT